MSTREEVLELEPVQTLRTQHRRRLPLVNLSFGVPAAVLILLLLLYPVYVLLRMSVSEVKLRNILGEWPIVGASNYVDLINDDVFRHVSLQTVAFLIATVTVTMVASFVIGLALTPQTKLSGFAGVLMMLVWTLPLVVVGSMWKFLLATDGVINALLIGIGPISFVSTSTWALTSIAAVTAWVSIPFSAVVLRSAILDVPTDVIEAAHVDGAGRGTMIRRIILPSIWPTLAILIVLNIVGAFKAFDLIYVMTKGGPGTSSTTIPYLGYLRAFRDFDFGSAAAISILAMLFVLVLSIVYIRGTAKDES